MSIKRGRKWWWQWQHWQHRKKVFWQEGFAKWKSWTEFCPCMCLSEWSRVVYFRNSDFHTSWFGRPLKLDSLVLATSFLPCVQLCAPFRSTFSVITGTHLCWMDQKGRNPGRKNSAHKKVSIFQYFRVKRIHNVGAHWLFHGLWFLGLHTLKGIHVLESLDHDLTKPKHQTRYIPWIRPVAMSVVLRSKNQLYFNMKDCRRKRSNMEWLFYMWQEQLASSRNSRLLNFSLRWERWMSQWNIIHSRPNLLSSLHLTASSSLHLKNALMC